MNFVIACGGTGGHVFPGLAVANALKRRGHQVTVWFSGRAVEDSTKHDWDGAIFETGAPRLNAKGLMRIPRVVLRCIRELRRNRPDAILAMGSYTSLPPVLAARLLHIPVNLHEANAVPGKAIRFLARFASHIAVSFPSTRNCFPGRTVSCTGLPVRTSVFARPPLPDFPPDDTTLTILITGGSQGAHAVNELAADALCSLPSESIRVIHQCGRADAADLDARYSKVGIRHLVSPFIADMGAAYASADLVIARAGASTCFELCALGKPAILIPLPSAMNDHQTLNAQAMSQCGGALLCPQADLTPEKLTALLKAFASDRPRLTRMGSTLKELAVPDATKEICQLLERGD